MASRAQYPASDQHQGYGAGHIQQDYHGGEPMAGGAYRQPRQNMPQQHKSNPQLRATFTPGGVDDFYMPEVISPAPQRVMPEVPENIQENLAHLELEANPPRKTSGVWSSGQNANGGRLEHVEMAATPLPPRRSSLMQSASDGSLAQGQPQPLSDRHRRAVSEVPSIAESNYSDDASAAYGEHDYRQAAATAEHPVEPPNFSPFPKLENAPANVPPSDDEKEATLESARVPVLNSNDPEMQLAWAQDALAYVEVAIQHELRMAEHEPARPQTPQTEHQLRVDAISIVSFLADQHHPRAEFMRGMWLEFGKFGFRVDKKEAFRCYSRAAENGFARAEYRIGMQYESSNDAAKAIKHYEKGVALGDSASNYRLGMMALLGQHGQAQDFAKGVQLIRYAAGHADENAPQGAYVYGMLQAHELEHLNVPELFLPLDVNGARANIEKAAYLGFAKAQLKMGAAYELCQLGCDFNPALSLHYNALAARQGEAEADMAISKWFLCGYDGLFAKNDELAFVYAQRAARSELPTAEFAMGYFHEIGMYVAADLKEAQRWYGIAAGHGNKDAAGRIDGISRSNTLSKKDHEKVAIAKIRSQYGSQRGKRPDRFRTQAAAAASTMPTIDDERVDMPDPAASVGAGGDADGPPDRLAASTPYPVEDTMVADERRPSLGPGFTVNPALNAAVNPAARPTSAFGINPNLRPHGAAAGQAPAGPIYYRGAPMPARPTTASPNPQAQWGRGGGGGGGVGRGGRVGSGQLASGYRAPGSGGGLSPEMLAQGENGGNAATPRLDIGYSAPPDPALDRLHGIYRQPQAGNGGGASPTVAPRVGGEPPLLSPESGNVRRPIRSSSREHSPSSSTASAALSPQAQNGRGPPNRLSRSSSPHTRHELPARNMRAGLEPTQAGPRPGGHGPGPNRGHGPGPGPEAKAPPARLPGQGPKTFEEMGVPVAAKESDCVVM